MKIALALLFILINLFSNAQVSDTINSKPKTFRNSFFLELGGAARTASINYERVLASKERGYRVFVRAGLGGFRRALDLGGVEETPLILVLPMEVSVCNAFSNHSVNVGIGVAPTWDKQTYFDFSQGAGIRNEFYMTGFARIGYLYQGPKGMLLKVAFMPLLAKAFETPPNFVLIGNTRKLIPWAGMSIGQAF